ncbi:MAG: cytochrome b5-like heme/steroid binding domain-containing protein [Candidatus Doudnabacteria bacterium]
MLTAISSTVYDLTSWIGKHPGGDQAILSLCGTDGTAAFNQAHGMNENAKKAITQFPIGALSN